MSDIQGRGAQAREGSVDRRGTGFGTTALVGGLVALVLTSATAVGTFTPIAETIHLNGTVMLVGFLGPVVALVGAVAGVLGLGTAARWRALAGLVISIVSGVAWLPILTMRPWGT